MGSRLRVYPSFRLRRMRRWTVLLIPHDTDVPRTIAVSARAARTTAAAVAVVALAAVVGVGAMAGWIARPDSAERDRQLSAPTGTVASLSGSAVDSLRATVEALYSALDTIRQADARLREAAGLPQVDSASLQAHAEMATTRAAADSLLRGANLVAGRLGKMADSARSRGRASWTESTSVSTPKDGVRR